MLLAAILQQVVGWLGLGRVRAGINVSDRIKGWKKNYRCPEVAVFLTGTKAQNCGTHWFGGPDFAAEIMSPKDRSREKLGFYAKVGLRELLLVDRKPWSLELYRLQDGRLVPVGRASVSNCEAESSPSPSICFLGRIGRRSK